MSTEMVSQKSGETQSANLTDNGPTPVAEKIHFSHSLLTDKQKKYIEHMKETRTTCGMTYRVYPLGIGHQDWGIIFGLFIVFYCLLTTVFTVLNIANSNVDGPELMLTFFCLMIFGFVCVFFAIHFGAKAAEDAKKEAERGATTLGTAKV